MTIRLNGPLPAYFFRERPSTLFHGDLDSVTIAGVNEQEPRFRLLLRNDRNVIDQLISDFFCRVVARLLVRLAPSQGRDVGQVRSVGKPDFSTAFDSSENDRVVPGLKSQKNLIKLPIVEINGASYFSLKMRKERGVAKKTKKEHFYWLLKDIAQGAQNSYNACGNGKIVLDIADFHGLLLSVSNFCLPAIFSHAWEKAFPFFWLAKKLNHALRPSQCFSKNSSAGFDLKFDDVLFSGHNKKQYFNGTGVGAQRHGTDVRIANFMTWQDLGRLGINVPNQVVSVKLFRNVDGTVAEKSFKDVLKRAWLQCEGDRVKLFSLVNDRKPQIPAQTRGTVFLCGLENTHEYLRKLKVFSFHGLLLSLRDFDLRPLFSHALEKAPTSRCRPGVLT